MCFSQGGPDPLEYPTHPKNRQDPTASASWWRVFITRNWFWRVRFRFSSLKTQTDWKNSKFRPKFSQFWRNLFEFGEIFLRFVFFPTFSRRLESDRPAHHLLMFWTAQPNYSGGCLFFPPNSDGSIPGWAQTWPVDNPSFSSQFYFFIFLFFIF